MKFNDSTGFCLNLNENCIKFEMNLPINQKKNESNDLCLYDTNCYWFEIFKKLLFKVPSSLLDKKKLTVEVEMEAVHFCF